MTDGPQYIVTRARITHPDGTRTILEGPFAIELWTTTREYIAIGASEERLHLARTMTHNLRITENESTP